MNRTKRNRSRKGFTLIELLVVIAIIAILAAILFPVFAKAREKARQSSCTSNLKQIGIGIMQYTQDYDEYYPPSAWSSSPWSPWSVFMYPYVKSQAVFMCPDDVNTGILPNTNTFTPTQFPVYRTSYGYNMWIGGIPGSTAAPILNQAKFVSASGTVMLADSGKWPVIGGNSVNAVDWPDAAPTNGGLVYTPDRLVDWNALINKMGNTTGWPNNEYGALNPRHTEMVNVAWADGHVKACKVEQIFVNTSSNVGGAASPCFQPSMSCQ